MLAGIEGLTVGEFAVVSLVVVIGAVVQGWLGFGLAFFVLPVLALFAPAAVPATIVCLALPLSVLVALRERSAIDVDGLGWLVSGRMIGTALGVGLLLVVPAGALQILFGLLLLAAAAITAVGPAVPLRRDTRLLAGALSGLMGTAAGLGGPALSLAYRQQSGPVLRSTAGLTMAVGVVLSLAGLTLAGELDMAHVLLAAWLAPALLLGMAASSLPARLLSERTLQVAVLAFAALAGLTMAVAGATGL